jgi:phage/conjugal plasmid C-4 type zinc finger TraR family protein
MSGTSNFDIELAEARVEMEREAGLARVKASLEGTGSATCVDCENPIPEPRRLAMPSARRCAGCQSDFERMAKC